MHFHLLVLDGVYRRKGESRLRFVRVPAPSTAELKREGQKVFTLQTLPAKLEHLARYVVRPPVATERLSLTEGGFVRLAVTTPYRDATTHVIFEPEDFMARLAALVPKPCARLTRYHGVFAPASSDRARVVPKTRAAAAGKAREPSEPSAVDRQRSLSFKRDASNVSLRSTSKTGEWLWKRRHEAMVYRAPRARSALRRAERP